MVTRLEVSAPDLADLGTALKYEQDGAVMRRDLLRNLRAAIKPATEEAKSSIMSAPAGGLRQQSNGKWHLGSKKQAGGSMRRAIARQVKTEVSLTAKKAKVKVKVRKKSMPRGFDNAPRAWNSAKGWRHPVIGTKGQRWVQQMGKPGWFDDPLIAGKDRYRAAIERAMQDTANRIARKV